jgi:hypothetical protein
MEYKVEILTKKKDFVDDYIVFLSEKSVQFGRNFSIDNILNETVSLNKIHYLEKNSPIIVDNVFGSTFQSSYRNNDDIYAISHEVYSLEVINGKFYATIKPSNYVDIIDFDKGKLRPIYYKKDNKSEYQIATFDIDMNIMREE